MARRPDETRGSLIFQAGKCIEGDYYIVAVYDDPATCTISFSAYELENDCTYTYPLTYSQFDSLFQYDSELMNPSNKDGRFHWVIERLDFVQDKRGQKVLCLGEEATAEVEEHDELVEEKKAKAQGGAPANVGGKIDAATRAKLLKELDTHDDAKLHATLVKSEGARKRFVAELHAKRNLEQLKASQRLQRADEEREARLAKLEIIKKQQQAKADAHRAKEEAKKTTSAQLEVLMKQKEAQAIRRLIQEKEAADRGQGREKDAARQRRKMQERSAAEIAAIEAERSHQLGQKREEFVQKRETLVLKRNRQIAQQLREEKVLTREEKNKIRERKEVMMADYWKKRAEAREVIEEKRREFERLEVTRDKLHVEARRALEELKQLKLIRKMFAEEKEIVLKRREKERKEHALQAKVDASDRALAAREQARRNERREAMIQAREDARLRRFRETQFLDTMKSTRSLMPGAGATAEVLDLDATEDPNATLNPAKFGEASTKSFEQIERQKRHTKREERRKLDEAKKSKMQQLSGTNPNTAEMLKVREWRMQDEKQKKLIEDAKLKREIEQERAAREQLERGQRREELWQQLEVVRQERTLEREKNRLQAVTERTKALPMGRALPSVLVF